MNHKTIGIIGMVCLTAILVYTFRKWGKKILKKKQVQEQISRKMRENELDQALHNRAHGMEEQSESCTPSEVHYNHESHTKSLPRMIRLTGIEGNITKEYLVKRAEIIYLGEEYGQGAVFKSGKKNKICCEIFPIQDELYVRARKGETCRVLRRRKAALFGMEGLRLNSGDIIEISVGKFRIEFI